MTMGALIDHRKRHSIDIDLSPPSKNPRLPSPPLTPSPTPPSRHFPPPSPFLRPVHGPQRNLRAFRLGSVGGSIRRANPDPKQWDFRREIPKMGNFVGNFVSRIFGFRKEQSHGGIGLDDYKKMVGNSEVRSFVPAVSDLTVVTRKEEEPLEGLVLSRKVEDARKVTLESVTVREEKGWEKREPLYKELWEEAKRRDSKLSWLEFELRLAEEQVSALRIGREAQAKKPKEDSHEVFFPLTDEEEDEVHYAMNGGSSREVLVTHEASNIEITREVLGCLRSGAWLNDEVINLYLELLKERERREPKRFLKCHFFNTFFYKKLISGGNGYDFKAVRRWTTQRKLGYGLIDCDKVFVPIHKEIHWCLAVINVKDQTFQYLDSLGGKDTYALSVLARYFVDEVKDKSGKQIDTSSWKQERVPDLPHQQNGWDCGMFMLKYTDFYSRGLNLCFNQGHMEYFRKRTAKEILRLRAE